MADASDEEEKGAEPPIQETEGEGQRQNLPDGKSRGYSTQGELALPGLLRPIVDLVARVKAGVQLKLLAGFFVGAMLLLAMAILSLFVIDRMDRRVGEVTDLQENVDRSRQAIYLVTAQSHFRAMALVCESVQALPTESPTDCTPEIPWNDKIAGAKEAFTEHLDELDRSSPPEQEALVSRAIDTDGRFAIASEAVLALDQAGDVEGALDTHIGEEHEVSHELEAALNELISDSSAEMTEAVAAFNSDRRVLTAVVGIFSGVSLVSSLFLGFVLSWTFVRPVRRVDQALARIAGGDFTQRVEVPNRDEFGTLSLNLNQMTGQLGTIYEDMRSLNENLQEKVDEQVDELERAARLKRYLSPQVADSILAGETEVDLASRRRNLTIFFSDIRGFTELSERLEPEELVDMLNQYLTAMTEVVFKYGGTLDKYIGDAIMVFFGDPITYEDHAERAVKMALEMRAKLAELQQRWFVEHEETLTIGMGISTGYVTVGNIGSAARTDYTVVGNQVNLASRLADRAKAGQILVSERTMVAIRELVDGTEIDQIQLEGVHRPIRIYEVEEKGGSG